MNMLSTLGQFILWCALGFACLQSVIPLFGYWRSKPALLVIARSCALGQFIVLLMAYSLLTFAFLRNDFSIAYIAANSHETLPFLYRLTAVWGAHEGSILFWILMLNVWTIIFIYINRAQLCRAALFHLTIAICGLISFLFLLFLILTSNPFWPSPSFMQGHDLNPLLQDPGFIVHPPFLYTGYVGSLIAFAITLAQLFVGELNSQWARLIRPFVISAWCLLTIGILLGSWWAYHVLGWGGFWFWDPVENVSLLPWLSGAALIHVLIIVMNRNLAKNWAALLAITTFLLSLLGTFLVRSGILVSAHTFANDPARGVFLLTMLGSVTLGSFSLFLWRWQKKETERIKLHLLSREVSLMLNSVLLIVAMLIILLGTIYPLLLEAFGFGLISVGAPYFNIVMLPLIILLMLVMSIGPTFNWQITSSFDIWQTWLKQILLSMSFAAFLLLFVFQNFNASTFIGLSLCLTILLSVKNSVKKKPGMFFAHIGFALFVIGILLTSLLNEEHQVRVRPGEAVHVGPYQFFFLNIERADDSNYQSIRANFDVIKKDRHIVFLHPEKRIYPIRNMVMNHIDIHPSLFRDLYIALGEPLDNNDWSVRIYYKPFIRFIWFGALIMAFGGFLTLYRRAK